LISLHQRYEDKMVEVIRQSDKDESDYTPLEDKELLFELLQALTAHPKNIDIDEKINGPDTILTISVHPEDLAKVIGRQGKMIKAIQHVFQGVGAADKRKVFVKLNNGVVEPKKRIPRSRNYASRIMDSRA